MNDLMWLRELRILDRFLASGCENPLVFLFKFFLGGSK